MIKEDVSQRVCVQSPLFAGGKILVRGFFIAKTSAVSQLYGSHGVERTSLKLQTTSTLSRDGPFWEHHRVCGLGSLP